MYFLQITLMVPLELLVNVDYYILFPIRSYSSIPFPNILVGCWSCLIVTGQFLKVIFKIKICLNSALFYYSGNGLAVAVFFSTHHFS